MEWPWAIELRMSLSLEVSVQFREPPHQAADPPGHLAEPAPRVENHHVGAAQLAKIEDVIRLGYPADHGHVRADRETGGEGVT